MATQAIRDQNLNVHLDVPPSVLKTNKPQKNGGLGGRKALGDISNSRIPSTIQPPHKLSSKNLISIEEDFVPAIIKSSVGAKAKVSSKGSGRRALGDLTNSVIKPRGIVQEPKKVQDKKLSVVVEEPFVIASEGIDEHFLHDHGECVKAQKRAKALEMDSFLKSYGLDNSMQSSPPSSKMKPESPIRVQEMEEVFEPWYEGTSKWKKYEVASEENFCASPEPLSRFKWNEYILSNLELKGSP